ncbi:MULTISPECIES: hypothetical protein [unclassified Flavobacterium]|jgi:hypothetical protein|uniref:hypothetical protein n=1 Tax=unclassified Flavobacterium TaxID=196869 RepID=UPI00064A743A|nr:hypothetical protein [Flavobacterium sp. ABG]KLT69146.1 hypothetical protein AB674_13710 [Flavobacterium sp. ABG]
MVKALKIVSLLVVVVLLSCNSKEGQDSYRSVLYRAVNNKDTAILRLKMNNKRFYGRYEILHYKIGKDSGDVRGDIKENILRGDYHYITFGGSWKRVPLALLKKDNKLILGSGVVGTYMNLPCYVPDVPIDYKNGRFVFEEIKQ